MRPTRTLVALPALAVAAVLAPAAPAAAQSAAARTQSASMVAKPGTDGGGGGSYRSIVEEWMIDPRVTTEVGAELRFLTSRVGVEDQKLRFTDVGFASLSLRHAFGARAEIGASIDLLAKQPSWMDESPLQGAHVGARVAVAKKWVAWARAGGAPLLADRGYLAETSAGLETRTRIDQTVVFQGTLGGAYTPLFVDGGERPWFAELVAGGQAILRAPHGEAGLWLGIDYRVPLAHRDSASLPLDPSTRLGFSTGVVLGFIPRWDLYVGASVTDRGDAIAPETMLPVLDGGFDQVNFVFGAVRRWERKDELPESAQQLAY